MAPESWWTCEATGLTGKPESPWCTASPAGVGAAPRGRAPTVGPGSPECSQDAPPQHQSQTARLPPQGVSPAGGCLISLTCDYRVLADNPKYTMGLNETLLGIVAPSW